MIDRFQAGQTIYTVVYENDVPVLYTAEYVGRNRSWYTLRNPDTGATWKENGSYWWYPSPETAFLKEVERQASLLADPAMTEIRQLTHGRVLARLVRCAVRLDRILSKGTRQ